MKKPRVPKIGERVMTNHHNGEFKVVRVDEKAGLADLELMSGTHLIEKAIAFSDIHPVREDVNQAAARVVREATKDI
jgi:hypothetical protein